MKPAVMLMFSTVLFSFKLNAQDSAKVKKTNPIVYAELLFGYAAKKNTNLEFGASINYQLQKNLLTLRSTVLVYFLYPDQYVEYGFLYGKRFINDYYSLSYSLGISYNRTDLYGPYSTLKKDVFAGVPFEFNIKWFDAEKEPIRILGIFPVSKPIAFGASEGFKIQGNISKNSYIALGVVFGFGFHKHY